jgi:hypothetical protein
MAPAASRSGFEFLQKPGRFCPDLRAKPASFVAGPVQIARGKLNALATIADVAILAVMFGCGHCMSPGAQSNGRPAAYNF